MRDDDIVFEYQLSEFKLSNEIRKSCETDESEKNSHLAEWLKAADSTNSG